MTSRGRADLLPDPRARTTRPAHTRYQTALLNRLGATVLAGSLMHPSSQELCGHRLESCAQSASVQSACPFSLGWNQSPSNVASVREHEH